MEIIIGCRPRKSSYIQFVNNVLVHFWHQDGIHQVIVVEILTEGLCSVVFVEGGSNMVDITLILLHLAVL